MTTADRNNRSAALFDHILALERLQEAKDDANADFNERKKLAKTDGFDPNILTAILKRRKNGEGQTAAFDDLLQEYELMIEKETRSRDFLRNATVDEVDGVTRITVKMDGDDTVQ